MIWGIGDLHFDHTKDKSMDIFGGNWINHEEKIIEDWISRVSDDDIVLVAGDISWALKIEDAKSDLTRIDELPGEKYFIKGNHDYWWASLNKLNSLGLKTINFIQNNHFINGSVAIFGTRAWLPRDADNFTPEDEKIFKRELMRLENSLKSYTNEDESITKIVMIHFPPFSSNGKPNEFVALMEKYNVDNCVYGHLHGDGHVFVKEGTFNNMDIKCVSSDFLDFKLKKIL